MLFSSQTHRHASTATYAEAKTAELLLRRATSISSDDPPELAAIARQRGA